MAITSTRSSTYGGTGGKSFDDSHIIEDWGRIQQIIVRSGTVVDAITVVYANGTRLSHGGTGGSERSFVLASDEVITRVKGRSGSKLDQITFVSNKKTYGPYGGSGGSAFDNNFGKTLHYIFGRSGAAIDQIGFGFGDTPPALASEVSTSKTYGGTGGGAFDDFKTNSGLLGKIEKITVRSGSRVDSVAFKYQGVDETSHGGSGGSSHEFTLGEQEWVTKITGRSGTRVDQLQFYTNKNKVSPAYGGTGGSPFTVEVSNHVLTAIFGRSGEGLDQIGFYLDSAKPISMSIQSLTFDESVASVLDAQPIAGTTVYLQNSSSAAQTVSSTVSVTQESEETSTISEMQGFSIEFSAEKEFAFATLGVKTGYQYQSTTTVAKTYRSSTTTSFTFNATVPANSRMTATSVVKKKQYDLPWTAQVAIRYQNLPDPVVKTLHGVLKGVNMGIITAEYGKAEPLA